MRYPLALIPFCMSVAHCQANDVNHVRMLYYRAAEQGQTRQFLQTMERADVTKNPVLLCYKGLACMMAAKEGINPYTKLREFNRGKAMIQEAVKRDPQNAEIRFLRYGAQTNAPSFLNYNKNIQEDEDFLFENLASVPDADLRKRIATYLKKASVTAE